jgi:hypothetical protein
MFSGPEHFSPHDSDVVLSDLGSKFVLGLVRATDGARHDFAELRAWRPSWVADMFERGLANVIHERLWSHLAQELEGVDGITLTSREPLREVAVTTLSGRTYHLRFKRHSDRDSISSYPTRSDIAFWTGGSHDQFDGMEVVSLAAGYRWDRERRELGAPVISFRETKSRVAWAVEVDEGAADAALPFTYTPIVLPGLPPVDLHGSAAEDAGTAADDA